MPTPGVAGDLDDTTVLGQCHGDDDATHQGDDEADESERDGKDGDSHDNPRLYRLIGTRAA